MSINTSIQLTRQSLTLHFLKALASIPGNVSETLLSAVLGLVFIAWQICVLFIRGEVSGIVEVSLIAFQLAIVVVLFTKIIIWIKIKNNE